MSAYFASLRDAATSAAAPITRKRHHSRMTRRKDKSQWYPNTLTCRSSMVCRVKTGFRHRLILEYGGPRKVVVVDVRHPKYQHISLTKRTDKSGKVCCLICYSQLGCHPGGLCLLPKAGDASEDTSYSQPPSLTGKLAWIHGCGRGRNWWCVGWNVSVMHQTL